ncbi:MAG: hypothetical protein WCT06_03600 [Armatimonadota bacterium]
MPPAKEYLEEREVRKMYGRLFGKWFCTSLIAIGALCWFLLPAFAGTDADNLIKNGDFSGPVVNGLPSAWNPWTSDVSGVSVNKDADGSFVSIKKEMNTTWYLRQRINTKDLHGKALVFSAKVKVEGINDFRYEYSGGRLTIVTSGKVVKEIALKEDCNWKKVTLTPWVVPDDVDFIYALIGFHTTKGKFSFRDVSLMPVAQNTAK